MGIQPAKRSNLFLMELIIAILFFCLASAICVRFFVKARLVEQETNELRHGVNDAASVAELFCDGAGFSVRVIEQYPEALVEEEQENIKVTAFFDSKWKNCRKESAAYILVLEGNMPKTAGALAKADICMNKMDTGQEIYQLDVIRYLREGNEN